MQLKNDNVQEKRCMNYEVKEWDYKGRSIKSDEKSHKN